jgi:DHA1 family tetracycline resistance protein-like MFS transporter
MSEAPAKPQRSVLGIAFLTLFLDLLGFGIIIPVAPFYAESFGATPAVVTLMGASYSLMQFLFAPMWGALSDRYGRRPIVLTSILIGGIGWLVFGLAGSLWMLFASRMIAGFGNANIGTVQAIVADVTTGKDRAKGMGMMGAAFGLGFVIGPVVGGLVGSTWGPHAPAFVAAGLAGLNLVLAFFRLPETRVPGAASEPRGFLGLAALGRAKGNLAALFAIGFVFTAGFALMEATLALFVEHTFVAKDILGTAEGHKSATRLTTWVLLAVGVTAVIVQGGLIGRLKQRFSEKALIIAGCALLVVSFVAVPFAPAYGYSAMFPVIIVLSFGSGIFSPSSSSLLSRSAAGHEQGAMLGLGQSMSALGRIVGPASAGLLFERGHGVPFFAGAALIGIGLLIALTLKQPAEV